MLPLLAAAAISAYSAYDSSNRMADSQRGATRAQMAPFRLQSPYLSDLYSRAQSLYRTGAGGTPGFSQTTQDAMGMIGDRARNNPFMPRASGALSGFFDYSSPLMQTMVNTASGGYLNPNPYIDATFNKAAGAVSDQYLNTVVPSIRGSFGTAGGYNRGAEAQTFGQANRDYGKTLNNLATDIYGGNYQAERDRMEQSQGRMGDLQLNALGMAPQFNAASYSDFDRLLGIGQMQDQLARTQANDPWTRLQNYQSAISQTPPGVNVQPMQTTNPYLQALGAGLYTYGMMNGYNTPANASSNVAPTTTMV